MSFRQNCKLACGTCNGGTGAITNSETSAKTVCVDKMRKCPDWKSMCSQQPTIMREKCPVTCGVCIPEPTQSTASVPSVPQPTQLSTTTTTTTPLVTEKPEISCLNGPLCDHYKSNWEINCRDSDSFREQCPLLCRIPVSFFIK